MSYCEGQDQWCSDDHYASRNSYVTWLTAVCLATAAMVWYEKKLMVMVLLWYITVMFFVFVPSATMWAVMLVVDLLAYYTFEFIDDLYSYFGAMTNSYTFVMIRFYGDHDDDDEDGGDEDGQKVGRSSLDPFGQRATRELLDAVIEDKLVMKRDEKLIAMLRNKEKLRKEAQRRKREAQRLGKKHWTVRLRESVRTKWEGLKSTFYGIERDTKVTMDKYVSEQEQGDSQREKGGLDDGGPDAENNGLLGEEWIHQEVVEEDTESTEDSTR